jgi:hypothetical protein
MWPGAVTYTLLVLTAALLARGRASGRQGMVAALLTAGIMLSPEHGQGVFLLLMAPDHIGTCVPVLLVWLILDRVPPRWYVPVLVSLLLAWVLVADPLVLVIAVLPLVAVCAVRAYQAAVRRHLPLRSQWYELSLIAAGLAAAALARLALAAIRASGGFVAAPVATRPAALTQLPHHLLVLARALPVLFGAGPSGQRPGLGTMLLAAHIAGLGLAVWGTCVAARRFSRDRDLIAQLLVTAILLNLATFVLWSGVSGITSAREIVALLPFSAVLAGRMLAPRLGTRLLRALSVVLAVYLFGLVQLALLPAHPPQYQPLATWLVRHHLRYGLGSSWLDGAVTLGSSGRVHLLPVSGQDGTLTPGHWEAKAAWFSPRLHNANFVALAGDPPQPSVADTRATFGAPARVCHFGSYTVLVWDKNLLASPVLIGGTMGDVPAGLGIPAARRPDPVRSDP